MSGNNVAVYLNGRLKKYYKFYQIYDYCFLGFNDNDPIDYIKFDMAEINEDEINLYQRLDDFYRVQVKTQEGDAFVYDSVKTGNYMDVIKDMADLFEDRLIDATVKELHVELIEGGK